MNSYQLKRIGKIDFIEKKIIILKDYHKGIMKLDGFSHIHVFYLANQELKNLIVKLAGMDRQKGIIHFTNSIITDGTYDLFDIKPYMPSEDSIPFYKGGDFKTSINIMSIDDGLFEIKQISAIRKINHQIFLTDIKIPKSVKYLKLFWWFDKFDSDIYREVTECNPPYENAPRSGVFATRSPVRPNLIAMTIVKVKEIDESNQRVYLSDIEAFDHTPVIGVEEYSYDLDYVSDSLLPEYLKFWPKEIKFDNDDVTSLTKSLQPSFLANFRNNINQEEETPTSEKKEDGIYVVGAKENNLKGINVFIPYNKITAVVGVSGSGKSSLVNDTIYQECRRKMEFLTGSHNVLYKPNASCFTGCIPVVLIEQSPIRGNSLSTVGTYSGAYDYLRMIFSSIGTIYCPTCHNEIISLSKDKIFDLVNNNHFEHVQDIYENEINLKQVEPFLTKDGAIKVDYQGNKYFLQTNKKCYTCNKILFDVSPQTFSYLNPDSRCPICNGTGEEVVIDDAKLIEHPNLSLLEGACGFYGKLKSFLKAPNANWMKGQVFGLADYLKVDLNTPWCNLSAEFKEALLNGLDKEVSFSYNNPKNNRTGVISRKVEGLKSIIYRCYQEDTSSSLAKYMTRKLCSACQGERLSVFSRMISINGIRYPVVAAYSFNDILSFCNELKHTLTNEDYQLIKNNLHSLIDICNSAVKLGIGYLPLSQKTVTLSGGEGQRLKLVGAYINHLSNILYIFDEPSKGLDSRDYLPVIEMIKNLRDEKNTILMVEHNQDMIACADNIIEIGPLAGKNGGQVVGQGSLPEMLNNQATQISEYWNKQYEAPETNILTNDFIYLNNLAKLYLKHIDIAFPLNAITVIHGVSGSGKSTLVRQEIAPRMLAENIFNEVILIDQNPIGKNSKSIIATYIGIMDKLRELFSQTSKAKELGLGAEAFSFNNTSGQCQTCHGDGRIEVKFIDDSFIRCPDCEGKRYNKTVLSINYQGLNLAEIFNLSITEGINFFKDEEIIYKLQALNDVGLGYLTIGQMTKTLSGGEASRLKIASKLLENKNNNLYLLDEPTTGLHFSDIENLLKLIRRMVEKKNTFIVIEHNERFIKASNWKIELGPGSSVAGGEVVYMGK